MSKYYYFSGLKLLEVYMIYFLKLIQVLQKSLKLNIFYIHSNYNFKD